MNYRVCFSCGKHVRVTEPRCWNCSVELNDTNITAESAETVRQALTQPLSHVQTGDASVDAAALSRANGGDASMKKCPFCAEDIQAAALLCKHCGSRLDAPPVHSDQVPREPAVRSRAAVAVAGALLLFVIALFSGAWPVSDASGRAVLTQGFAAPAAVVTKAEFDRIREGMSYTETTRVIGASGELQSSSELAGYKTVMYSWMNSNGSNMNAMFQNDRLINKAQFGLR